MSDMTTQTQTATPPARAQQLEALVAAAPDGASWIIRDSDEAKAIADALKAAGKSHSGIRLRRSASRVFFYTDSERNVVQAPRGHVHHARSPEAARQIADTLARIGRFERIMVRVDGTFVPFEAAVSDGPVQEPVKGVVAEDTPVVEQPVKTPVVETPVASEVEAPVNETPVEDTPVEEKPSPAPAERQPTDTVPLAPPLL